MRMDAELAELGRRTALVFREINAVRHREKELERELMHLGERIAAVMAQEEERGRAEREVDQVVEEHRSRLRAPGYINEHSGAYPLVEPPLPAAAPAPAIPWDHGDPITKL